jgi:hypothetical protein
VGWNRSGYFSYNRKHNNEVDIMLKKMIADELLGDATKDELIDEINKSIDIPIISEKTEKAILEALWKVIKKVLLSKLGM